MGASDDSTTVHRVGAFSTSSRRFVIEVVDGADRGARFAIEPAAPGRAMLGSSASCEARLTDPSVSRRHLAFEVVGAELHVEDLQSMNGTFVNAVRVERAFLRGGEALEVGASRLLVHAVDETRSPGLTGPSGFGLLVGGSPKMRRLYPLLERLAASHVPIVIEGETGTGKEVAAESIHRVSARASGPFVVFDCTTVPPNLAESILFGHEKGAFTGATATHRGVFEEAHGGTLLIDEIGDLELSLQPKLLRAIQSSEFRRVGAERSRTVDVRVIAATRRDLDREVQAGRFREDLYFRLNVGRVEMPPLRERVGDIQLLARHFWDALGGAGAPIPFDLFASWEDYTWPGNVRELENAVARRLALGDLAPPVGARTGAGSNEPDVGPPVDTSRPLAIVREQALQAIERRYLEQLLAEHGENPAAAAAVAGIGRRYLNMLRARYGL
jgi:DNA-binding NtrC family response regulator